jgi:hypothetical protein
MYTADKHSLLTSKAAQNFHWKTAYDLKTQVESSVDLLLSLLTANKETITEDRKHKECVTMDFHKGTYFYRGNNKTIKICV